MAVNDVTTGSGQQLVDNLLQTMSNQMQSLQELSDAILAKTTPSEIDLMAFNAKVTQWSTMVSIAASTVKTIEDTIKSVANR